ncbi:hypothetical protein JCM17823_08470 [Halorubrum gandharaense]
MIPFDRTRAGDDRADSGGRPGDRPTESRAVSETVGFVLVFGLITTTIAVTFTMGLGGLDAAQTAERDNNVERAFDVLHDNLQDISRDGVPSRATELRLAGGQLTFGERHDVEAYYGDDEVGSIYTRSLAYAGSGDTEIAYENGAVFRSDGDGSVMLNEPDLIVGDTIVFSAVDVGIGSATRVVGGDRTVLVVAERGDRGPHVAKDETVTVTHNGTQYPDAWERYYEDFDDDRVVDVERDGDEVVVTFDVDRFVFHETGVDVSLSD